MNRESTRLSGALLGFCRRVDTLNERISWLAAAAVLAACLISAGNAIVRYGWDISSNAWLEVQWYLFAVTVMLGAPYVLRRNEHVRVDIFYARLPERWAVMLDIAGLLVFLLPVMLLLTALSWPVFARALTSGEVSSNAGGLIRWPALLLLPLGFGLVSLQGIAEVIKRLAYLRSGVTTDQPAGAVPTAFADMSTDARPGTDAGTTASSPSPARYEKPLQ